MNDVELSQIQQKTLKQILTGIKYDKLKSEKVDNSETRLYNKKEKFNILEKVKRSIIIRYVSNKNGKHSSHKLPIMHWREGHWRVYKSGKKVWVKGCWINESTSNVRVAS